MFGYFFTHIPKTKNHVLHKENEGCCVFCACVYILSKFIHNVFFYRIQETEFAEKRGEMFCLTMFTKKQNYRNIKDFHFLIGLIKMTLNTFIL